MRYIDHESDNNGLVSENLIRLTPEEEDSGVFRYVLMKVKYLMPINVMVHRVCIPTQ